MFQLKLNATWGKSYLHVTIEFLLSQQKTFFNLLHLAVFIVRSSARNYGFQQALCLINDM